MFLQVVAQGLLKFVVRPSIVRILAIFIAWFITSGIFRFGPSIIASIALWAWETATAYKHKLWTFGKWTAFLMSVLVVAIYGVQPYLEEHPEHVDAFFVLFLHVCDKTRHWLNSILF